MHFMTFLSLCCSWSSGLLTIFCGGSCFGNGSQFATAGYVVALTHSFVVTSTPICTYTNINSCRQTRSACETCRYGLCFGKQDPRNCIVYPIAGRQTNNAAHLWSCISALQVCAHVCHALQPHLMKVCMHAACCWPPCTPPIV